MSHWLEAALAQCPMGDVRHTKRLARLFDRWRAPPVGSIPTAGHGWAETGAASRGLLHPNIGGQERVLGPTPATRARSRAQEVV
jgi:hypothetical protein